jgi:predicted metalloprotease with PDZ domain
VIAPTRLRLGFAAFAALFALSSARPAAATVRYEVSLDHPEQHLFHVTMTIPLQGDDVVVAMPAWNALYQVRDFAVRLVDLRAATGASAESDPKCDIRMLDKQTWRIIGAATCVPNHPGPLTLQYSIEWNDPGPFSSQLDAHHAFINLADILLYLPDRRSEDTEVQFENVPAGWRVAAELPAGPAQNSFTAAGYDTLVDAPTEAGKFDEFEFDSGGAHFRVVIDAKDWNKDRLEGELQRITSCELNLMGGPPFQEYTFLFHVGSYDLVGGGGMEHANSTAIAATSADAAAAIAAHEFFHAWNVKRIRPQSLQPVDYTKEQYTRALWFAEGVTSTYASYTLERAGLWSKDQFYTDLAEQITDLESRPARKWQSVEQSSLDAWFEKYGTYNSPDRSVSYYDKGQILGVLLDLAIRDATDDRKSLDDVLRRMNDEYAKAGKFYNDSDGVRAAVEEVSGKSFADFFSRYVSGTDDIPYNQFLSIAGLELKLTSTPMPDLGFDESTPFENAPVVSSVESGGPAEAAGLREGDVLISVNGKSASTGEAEWLASTAPGRNMKLRVNRDGQILEISYAAGTYNSMNAAIVEIPRASDRERRIRDALLRGSTD